MITISTRWLASGNRELLRDRASWRCRSETHSTYASAMVLSLPPNHFDDTRIIVVEQYVAQLSALGQTDRLAIFRLLVRAGPEGNCVEEIRRRVNMPGSTLSHHLDALTRCGLLTAQRSGRFIY